MFVLHFTIAILIHLVAIILIIFIAVVTSIYHTLADIIPPNPQTPPSIPEMPHTFNMDGFFFSSAFLMLASPVADEVAVTEEAQQVPPDAAMPFVLTDDSDWPRELALFNRQYVVSRRPLRMNGRRGSWDW